MYEETDTASIKWTDYTFKRCGVFITLKLKSVKLNGPASTSANIDFLSPLHWDIV